MTPLTSVYDYALEYAVSRGWVFRESEAVGIGLIRMDSRKGRVEVHPKSAAMTLEMNTSGPILPGAYDKDATT